MRFVWQLPFLAKRKWPSSTIRSSSASKTDSVETGENGIGADPLGDVVEVKNWLLVGSQEGAGGLKELPQIDGRQGRTIRVFAFSPGDRDG
jgi:hypothetical protein